jgi:hypothetical protein
MRDRERGGHERHLVLGRELGVEARDLLRGERVQLLEPRLGLGGEIAGGPVVGARAGARGDGGLLGLGCRFGLGLLGLRLGGPGHQGPALLARRAAHVPLPGDVVHLDVLEVGLPEQRHEIVVDMGLPGDEEHRIDQRVQLARRDRRAEGEPAHTVAMEGERQVVVTRLGRIERDLVEEHVVGREPVGDRAVLGKEAAERLEQLGAEADDGGIGGVIEPAGLERARELPDPGGDRLDRRIVRSLIGRDVRRRGRARGSAGRFQGHAGIPDVVGSGSANGLLGWDFHAVRLPPAE